MNFIFNQRFLWWVFASRSEFDWGFISCPNPQRCIPHVPQYEILHFITHNSHLFRLSDDNGLANVASVPPHYNLCSKYCNNHHHRRHNHQHHRRHDKIAAITTLHSGTPLTGGLRADVQQKEGGCEENCNRCEEINSDFSHPQVYWLKWLGFEKRCHFYALLLFLGAIIWVFGV